MNTLILFPKDLKHCQCTYLHTVPRGTELYFQGNSSHEFYFLEKGLVGLYHTLENGKESLVRIYKQGDYFGFRTLFGDGKYHCTAKILKKSEIIRITPKNLENFFSENPDIIRMLFQILANELRDAEGRLAKSAYLKSLDRIIDSICFLNENFPEYNWTNREIAEYTGCETETAIRITRELRKKNLL
ncbi:cyclic nucleotide-binding protein [Gallibacterium salpingitidis]|uniref:Cyclic nucleotide-binding protein n=1 Tax=Gallibacterium salpingitidis TaxID=505341 RepID=A0A1A7Q7H7_9PAST|nr:Crp/Fnr family transcriptional regulator [Gallibacterium salpingitidis]OBW91891.1 cyclic nucleotide-binding protein [Gallibacterium salpingitidis]OBX09852.1 cyclic nucleotide-binding protein [Gallibacterium salpingitidis]OBX11362.1 cyclic nucleotide-binding protein [Gallibacterium salpingitidis]